MGDLGSLAFSRRSILFFSVMSPVDVAEVFVVVEMPSWTWCMSNLVALASFANVAEAYFLFYVFSRRDMWERFSSISFTDVAEARL